MSKVRFNYADVKNISVRNKKNLQEFVIFIFKEEGIVLNMLNYIFCSDLYLLEINKSFLQHDYYTDIITFNLSEGSGMIGEIYISVERVKANYINYGYTYKDELLRVIFHGALHLCGYMDKKKSEITTMRQKEDYYLYLLKEKYPLCFT